MILLWLIFTLFSSPDGAGSSCPANQFECDDGHCVATFLICDNNIDCFDASDETPRACDFLDRYRSKTNEKPGVPEECPEDHWRCKSGECILESWRCDSGNDCSDASDEHGCQYNCTGFLCKDGNCISSRWRCDRAPDCKDASDEEGCPYNKSDPDCVYHCADGSRCLKSSRVCNKVIDCDDGSDENGLCDRGNCTAIDCHGDCINTPRGATCICSEGYRMSEGVCADLNECQVLGGSPPCSQVCTNTQGSYRCSCLAGFEEVGHSCHATGPDPLLIVSTRHGVSGYSTRSGNLTFSLDEGLVEIYGVTFMARDNFVVWSDSFRHDQEIVKRSLAGAGREAVVTSGLYHPSGIAYDWVANNLYISDALAGTILVCHPSGDACSVILVTTNVPRGIAVHPLKKLMFWSEWSHDPKIVTASMCGANPRSIVSTAISRPSGVAIDYPLDCLYWSDEHLGKIEQISFDGVKREVVVSNLARPSGLTVMEEYLYWIDSETRELSRCEKFTCKHRKTLMKQMEAYPTALHSYHPSYEKEVMNPCWSSRCSHLCVLSSEKVFRCLCPGGLEILDDGKTCIDHRNNSHILISAGNLILAFDESRIGRGKFEKYKAVDFPVGPIAYNSLDRKLYLVNNEKGQIKYVDDATQKLHDFAGSVPSVRCIEVDELNDHVYICNQYSRTVEVLKAVNNTSIRKVILEVGDGYPSSLSACPKLGYLFIAVTGDHPHIDRIGLDGSGEHHLVETKLRHPLGIVFEPEQMKLYILDSQAEKIEVVSVDGSERTTVKQYIGHPYALAVLNGNIFWTDLYLNELRWSDRSGASKNQKAKVNSEGSAVVSTALHLTVVNVGARLYETPCSIDNGGCSHFCFVQPGGQFRACGCPDDLVLGQDQRNCLLSRNCTDTTFKCGDGTCIPGIWRCDQKKDCEDNSDEDCPTTCRAGEFLCNNGACVPEYWHCDGDPDCADKSDEQNCPPKTCSDSEFKCQDKCIPLKWRCDDTKDCEDGSDEVDCPKKACTSAEFTCSDGKCVNFIYVCDDFPDCPDRSDEKNCTSSCAGFLCATGQCIEGSMVCDGFQDCDDSSDERNCTWKEATHLVNKGCEDGYFSCLSGPADCLQNSKKCDQTRDCPAGEDEMGCLCLSIEFTCSSGECVSRNFLCDGQQDCRDGSDEGFDQCRGTMKNSSLASFQPVTEAAPEVPRSCAGQYQCESGECVALADVCDGQNNCIDGSDEGIHCYESCFHNNGGCSQLCRPTPSGPQCLCETGYTLAAGNEKLCVDVDECSQEGFCSQLCTNTKGSAKCGCIEHYTLTHNRKFCKAEGDRPLLIFALLDSIRSLSLNGTVGVISSVRNAALLGVDSDSKEGFIFYSDAHSDSISYYDLNRRSAGLFVNVSRPLQIAYDWITKNIYCNRMLGSSDSDKHYVTSVCNRDGYCKDLVNHRQPVSDLSLAPHFGLLFWCTTSLNSHVPTGTIESSYMDGTGKRVLVKDKIVSASGIALDMVFRTLYWTDAWLDTIERVSWDGTDRKIITRRNLDFPLGISIFEDRIYWINYGRGVHTSDDSGVMTCSKFNGTECFMLHSHHVKAHALTVLQTANQPSGPNPCRENNCSHLCLAVPSGFSCACPTGMRFRYASQFQCVPENETEVEVPPEIVSCRKLACFHNGTCVLTSLGLERCICLPGYTGSRCQYMTIPPLEAEANHVVTGVVSTTVLLLLIVLAGFYYFKCHHTSSKPETSSRFTNPGFGVVTKDSDDKVSFRHFTIGGSINYSNPIFKEDPSPANKETAKGLSGSSVERQRCSSEESLVDCANDRMDYSMEEKLLS